MTEEWMPKDKAELMSAIEQEWKLLMEMVEKLTDTQMTTPDEGGWSPKDNLAHLSEWMNILMGYHIDHRPSHEVLGVPAEALTKWDLDIVNPLLFEKNRIHTTSQVLANLKQTYAGLTSKLNSMTFEDLMKPHHADDPEKRPLMLWVLGDTTEHFAEHRETIEKNINK